MNAALQALAHITPLRMYFIRTYFRRLRTQSDISADALFDNFIRAMWTAPQDYIDPYGLTTDIVSPVIAKSLVSFMWKRFPFLHPGEQHDAQEFLRCFLNELHDSLKIVDLRSTASTLIEQSGHARGHHHHHQGHGNSQLGSEQQQNLFHSDFVNKSDRIRAKQIAHELLCK